VICPPLPRAHRGPGAGSVRVHLSPGAAGEIPYRQFAQHIGAQFRQGQRFVNDLPDETSAGEDDVK
jgi:hypothetical protein